jgi:hypothetical protein
VRTDSITQMVGGTPHPVEHVLHAAALVGLAVVAVAIIEAAWAIIRRITS